MLHWIPLLPALALFALALLTAVPCPPWAPWRLAVLAGEFGHWLFPLPPALAAGAWYFRSPGVCAPALATTLLGILAAALLLKPCVQAANLAGTLRPRLAAAFGEVRVDRPAFSVAALFARAPGLVPVETLTYAAGLALDFYRPPAGQTGGAEAPCVVVIHGGGWDSGERTQFAEFHHWLAGRGYGVAAISYRLAPHFRWPAQQEDLLAALAWLRENAGDLGIDAGRIVLLGRSAGGQIAEAAGYAARHGSLRGVIGIYAPSDLHFGYAHAREDDAIKSPFLMRQYLGGPPDTAREAYDSASALQHTTPDSPSTLLLHGKLDTLVWHRHSERLTARLAELRVPHAFVSLPWAAHGFDYNLRGPGGQLTTFAVEWFLAAVTRPPGSRTKWDSDGDVAAPGFGR